MADDDVPETEGDTEVVPKARTTPTGKNPLSKDSDQAARPGFRSPSNARSKASRKKRKKR